jgi:signal transduction histidine kinase
MQGDPPPVTMSAPPVAGEKIAAPCRPMPAPDRRPKTSSQQLIHIQGVLDALDEAVCIVAASWRVLYMNAAFAQLAGIESTPRDLRDLFNELRQYPDTDLASMSDDSRRHWRVGREGARSDELQLSARRLPDGSVLIRARRTNGDGAIAEALAERVAENDAMREVTTALAHEADLDPLLRVICDQVAAQCGASGATVVRVREQRGHIVSASGALTAMIGTEFALAGSLTERAITERRPVRADDYRVDHPRFQQTAKQFEVGPALFAPLIAHGTTLGAITVARTPKAAPFTVREERRIAAIADYAALALWKAQLTEEARVANNAKGEFIATMSHELRTPLTALMGYEELFAEQILGPLNEQQESAMDRMRASTLHLQSIIDEVLTFSRLEAGTERAQTRETSLHEIVNGVVAVLEPLARAKHLELVIDVGDESGTLHTDPNFVRRILVNIGGNAVKFTDRGSVTLRVEQEDEWHLFRIADTGIGIAAEDLSRLFQPFTQLDSGFTRRYSGTGLGLFVSRRLAQLLGGDITVVSVPREGSEFTVRIPG